MKNNFLAFFILAVIAVPAMADNTGTFYIAGDLGTATYSNMEPFSNPGVIRIAGGYNFSSNLAAEVGYSVFGDSTITGPGGSATLSAASFQIAAVGTLPLSPQFDLIGKLGLSSNNAKMTANIPALGLNGSAGSTSQSDLLIGLGAQFRINAQTNLRVIYDNYGKFENTSSPMKASSISLGVVYNFQ
jgi:hypothetical protein